jgi:hypothetical protein
MILGMTDPKRPLPFKSLRYSSSWTLRPGYSLGTVALSSDVFLNGRLLPLLARINGATTLVPANLAMDKGRWNIRLVSWHKNAEEKDDGTYPTDWKPITAKNPHAFE